MYTKTINSRYWWLPALLLAALWRLIVLASGTLSFHSDEAIVGLMARHIMQGQPIPTFFYGQPYMGSLDPLLVSLAFRVLGESVLSIRLVQSVLYLLVIGTTMLLVVRMAGSRRAALIAGLFMAFPPTVVTLYTSISLGGYTETLLIGNLLLLTGYDLINGQSGWKQWIALGALVGVGWWTNNLIVVYVLPITILIIIKWRLVALRGLLIAGIAFFVFSAPWWIYNISHDWASVQFLLGGFQPVSGTFSLGIGDRAAGLLLLGIPAITGLRFSWSFALWAGIAAIPVIGLYVVLLVLARRVRNVRLIWAVLFSVITIFVVSSFGVDATGRYLLPMAIPLAILIALQIDAWLKRPRWLPIVVLVILVGANALGTIIAMRSVPPGITPQFDAATDFTNDYDAQTIQFLQAHGGQYGYSTYWVSYRLAFLSHETVILSPQLPYKATLAYIPSDRYPAYTAAVIDADRPVLVSANLPTLDATIVDRLAAAEITYQRETIGPYTIFYDLSRKVTPESLGLHDLALPAK